MKKDSSKRFVICTKNEDYKTSLEVRKIYLTLPDKKASRLNLVRIVDESGEDYLYPGDFFIPIDLPQTTEEALLKAG
jgi:hypothetical protein